MLIALLLILGAGYLTRRLFTARSVTTPGSSATHVPQANQDSASRSTRWTALDDHQLKRLLDESSP